MAFPLGAACTVALAAAAGAQGVHAALAQSGSVSADGVARRSSIRLPFDAVLRASNAATTGASNLYQTLAATIQLGTPPVTLSVVLDTGSPSFWVTSALCVQGNGCQAARKQLYNPNKSSTAASTGLVAQRSYGDGTSVQFEIFNDTLSIAGVDVPNQPVGAAVYFKDPTHAATDGLIGLAPPNVRDPVGVFGNLRSAFTRSMVSFYYNRKVISIDASGLVPNAGEITFGEPNRDRMAGEFAWLPINSTAPYWQTVVDSMTVNGVTAQANVQALIDTGTTDAIITPALFALVTRAIGSSLNVTTQVFDCSVAKSLPPITFRMSGMDFLIPWQNQVIVKNGVCYTIFSQGSATEMILGASFQRGFYTTFNFDNSSIGIARLAEDQTGSYDPFEGNMGSTKNGAGRARSGSVAALASLVVALAAGIALL
ncbi:hypothetical protein HK105_200900 [Polyrhizophydium stewartii]|uniref:Peptidase A1 domain-containing protein n=1 Tax=Polyrhizophydium stewartii TaxID=2732419 RepID=A0ABR4NIC0_9FUNG|nr:hypothetical protein HK105_005626 [Polyrhizophydium stewartii]